MTNKLAQINFQTITEKGLGSDYKYDPNTKIGTLITELLPYLFAIAGFALLVYLLMGGFKLMTSAGDPKKVQEGQHILTNAFIGFIVVFFAFFIVQIIAKLLGLSSVVSIF
ncbi:MAG: hypothetical protein AAB546_00520 [Patescibacteria group bacterium]